MLFVRVLNLCHLSMKVICARSVKRSSFLCLILFAGLLNRALAERECEYGLKVLWSAKLRDSPLTTSPLLFDVDGDGYNDVVVPSFSGEVWSVHGENGHIVDNWPFYLDDRAFHASPLVYDLNGDGVLEFLLTTTEAELVFVQSDNTLLHGETIKIPPFRVQRFWHQLDEGHLQKIAEEVSKITSQENIVHQQQRPDDRSGKASVMNLSDFTTPNSDFENRFGLHADPLYSRHQPGPLPSGLDPADNSFVFVDAHVLATPTLADTDGDGLQNELVVPVSYYFDPYLYGDKKLVQTNLGGLEQSELADYVAGGIVVIDLTTQTIVQQKILGITRTNSDQPAYQLATPTVVKMAQGDSDSVIIVGSATGKLHMLRANDLSSVAGFPLSVDSLSSQIAVADLFGEGVLNIVTGDHSGNVYCIDREGKRVWEQEVNVAVIASIRFADLEMDGKLEVILTTEGGNLWILNGQDGTPYPPNYPLHLNAAVQSSVLVMHLNSSRHGAQPEGKRSNALSVVMSTSDAIYIIDALTGCVFRHESEHMFMDILADDIDPYSPGLELLAISLDGYLVCFSTQTAHWTDLQYAVESWPGNSIGQNGFTHKSSSFALVLPHANSTVRVISGSSFNLDLQIYHSPTHLGTNTYRVQVTVGRKHLLYNDVVTVSNKVNDVRLVMQTPPSPLHCFVTVKVCNAHDQCDTQSYNVRFNMNFEDNLKWFLSLPFLFMCAFVLWAYRESGVDSLPTTRGRKNL